MRYRFLLSLLLLAFVLLPINRASAHPMPSSLVELRLSSDHIDAELTLPLIELKLGWQKPIPMDPDTMVRQFGPELREYVAAHVRPIAPDGRAWAVTVGDVTPVAGGSAAGTPASGTLPQASPDVRVQVTMTPPPGAPADRLTLNYDVILHQLITHTAIVSIVSDWRNGMLGDRPVVIGTLRDTSPSMELDRSQGSWWRGLAAVFKLGARHIAEGTDHLLFLLALLLPAPLVASAGRWSGYAGGRASLRRIVKVVTAFTAGHSVTLALGALGIARLPSALIESAIALSIVVSAVHALWPIFRGREVFIAGGFGLVHGLAFAATLTGFGFDPLTLLSSLLAFNSGIEAFQLLVIAVTMPWLVLLARTRLYPTVRIGGALLTGVAASAWFVERAFGAHNPIGPMVERAASHSVWILAGLVSLAIAATLWERRRAASPSPLPTAVRF